MEGLSIGMVRQIILQRSTSWEELVRPFPFQRISIRFLPRIDALGWPVRFHLEMLRAEATCLPR